MTRTEIKKLMRTRRREPYAEKRIRATLRQLAGKTSNTREEIETIRQLLKELKLRRELAQQKEQ